MGSGRSRPVFPGSKSLSAPYPLSPAHVRSLGIKLHVPQSTYSRSGGVLLPDGRRMNAFQRRRAINNVVRKTKAALAARR